MGAVRDVGEADSSFFSRGIFAAIGFSAMFRDLQIGSVHVATVLMIVAFLLFWRRTALRQLHLDTLVLLLSTLTLGLSAVGSTMMVNDLLWVQLALQASSFFALVCVLDRTRLYSLLAGMVIAATCSSALALAQQFRVVSGGLFADSSGLLRPTGLVGEPDWVGRYAAIAIVVLMRWRSERRALRWTAISINGLALFFSFARAAWLAFGISVLLALIVTRFRRRPGELALIFRPATVVMLLGVSLLVLLSAPEIGDTFVTRALSIFVDEHRDDNAIYRGQQLQALVQLAQAAPWHGWGLSSSARVTILGELQLSGDVSTQNAVATNWVLALLADGKVLALPFIAAVWGLAVCRSNTLGGQLMVVVATNSLFSNAMYVPIWWVCLALMVYLREPALEPNLRRGKLIAFNRSSE